MEVRIPRQLLTKLNRLAAQQHREPAALVRPAVERLVDYDAWFIGEVEKGLAQMERGEVLDHAEVARRLERWLHTGH